MPDCILLVRITGVEPARLTAIEPKSIVYAYFTISAFMPYFVYRASVPAIPTVLVPSVSAVELLIHFSSAICCTADRWGISLYHGKSCANLQQEELNLTSNP